MTLATNSRRTTQNGQTRPRSKSADSARNADGSGGLQGGVRPRFDGRTVAGLADERPAQRGLREYLRGESLGRGQETAAAGLGYQGIDARGHAGGVAARPAGTQHVRVLRPSVPDRGRGRAVPQLDGELRLQQRDRQVRARHPGLGRGAGTPDHNQPHTGWDGSGAKARRPDRRAGEVHGREAASSARHAAVSDARRGRGKASGPVGGNDIHLPQGRDAFAASGIDKVYCHPIPFATATQQHQAAIDAGRPPQAIYVEGRGAENFDTCVAQFRGQGGTLGLVGGLRVLGASRVMIVARVRRLKELGIRPYDLETGNTDELELLNAAIAKINGARALGEDPRRPRRIGAKGGLAKGLAAERRRNAVMHGDIVRRLCQAPELNWKRRAEILGGVPFSESTLRRLYGADS